MGSPTEGISGWVLSSLEAICACTLFPKVETFKFSMTKIQLNTLLITAVTYVQTLYCYVRELKFHFMGVGDQFDVWYISSSEAVACFF